MNAQLQILSSSTCEQFNRHKRAWNTCTRCKIGELARRHVFVRGTLPCDVLFVGMAPGKTENVTGWPFVGQAGKLLEDWMVNVPEALDWAITNLVCCRPTDQIGGSNRDPTDQEIGNCKPRLVDLLEIAMPSALVFLGRTAVRKAPWPDLPMLALYHPAYFLHSASVGGTKELEQRSKLADFLKETFYNTRASA